MRLDEVMQMLKDSADDSTKKIYERNGAKEPFFGVKMKYIGEIAKKVGHDHELAIALYDTGNSDAMYLAGEIEEPTKVSIEQLDEWVDKAYWNLLSERCVAPLAAQTPYKWEMARKWIKSDKTFIKTAGYALYSILFSRLPDSEINLEEARLLIADIASNIHNEEIHVQNAMNNCLVLAGISIKALHADALIAARKVGKIQPLVAKNECNTQTAEDYLIRYVDKEKTANKKAKK